VRTVTPLRHGPKEVTPPPAAKAVKKAPSAPDLEKLTDRPATLKPLSPASYPNPSTAGLDRRTAERLRKGQMPIDARLDLHGLRQHEARDALSRFLRLSAASRHRCVLVITGKGTRDFPTASDHDAPGVLRRSLPLWLAAPDIAPLILRHSPAKPKDGGSGAYYILLRRDRSGS
jgi:DNA-nicking Smr family endonuclease